MTKIVSFDTELLTQTMKACFQIDKLSKVSPDAEVLRLFRNSRRL